MGGKYMLCLKGIKKTYRNSNVETNALNGIDLTIERGEFAAIMVDQDVVNLHY